MTGPDSTAATPVPGSFRDPAGRVWDQDGVLVRTVAPGFAATFEAVRATGLYDTLVERGLLVGHEELDPADAPEPAHALLRPTRIPFVSHPYEWAPAQLRAAALLTLEVAEIALDHGCVLRDASAYNVQFRGTQPVLIDTLSFAPRQAEQPWAAHGQFCRHFLAPLAVQTLVDVRLADLLRTNIDGVPLDLASRLLPWRTRLRPGLLTHVHAHASASGAVVDGDGPRRTARVSDLALRGILDTLRGSVERLTWDPAGTPWARYYDEADHYDEAAMTAKTELVDSLVRTVGPRSVWDLGANTGRFSRIAAATGADVVALDVDHGAVERAHRSLEHDPVARGSVLPLRHDLVNPSPDLGWATAERASLAARGPADLVLALALVHHLAIGNNVPLPMIADHLATLGRHVLVEWVPSDDPKVRVLLATREGVGDGYDAAAFRRAFERRFRWVDEAPVGETGRHLHLLRTR